ncbi:ATP-binding protein [Candidatus Gracilibacteria bacterium]|nr:ATP-binding protein [Candidatus Gracilibacteria bacterium]
MYIKRILYQKIIDNLEENKVIVIYGPRRVGKTTLINEILKDYKDKYLLVSGEDIFIHEYLGSKSIEKLKNFIGDYKLLVIDEAQKIPEIGWNLKLIVDHIPGIKIIATGSSSFDLSNKIGEPLVGRKRTLQLFPISIKEISESQNFFQIMGNLEQYLIYGAYPEIFAKKDNKSKEIYLREIISSYLYKDILELEGIRYSDKILKLLALIAFQIGKEVSLSELGRQLEMNKNTVERYLDLLEKSFVLFRIKGFSRNLRKEISKSSRYYFYDLGIRNAVISNFNPLSLRNDIGELWENFLIIERLKKKSYFDLFSNNYFWRTHDQKEIDWIEDYDGKLHAYEFKWGDKLVKVPKSFMEAYPDSSFEVINKNNFLDFVL